MKQNTSKVKFSLNKTSIANLSESSMETIKGGYVPEVITSLFLCVNSRRNCAETFDNCTFDCPLITF